VSEAFNPSLEGESFTRTMMKFENGCVATLEMGGVPGAVYGPEPWRYRVLGSAGEVRVVRSASGHVEPDVVLFNSAHPDGEVTQHPVYKEHHGLLIQDFARTILRGETVGVAAADSLGESLTALAIYRANESGRWEPVFVPEAYPEGTVARM
jgi:hypothetical protein